MLQMIKQDAVTTETIGSPTAYKRRVIALETNLLLRNYTPKSQLIVERQFVSAPRFPVVDAHTHFGPMAFGKDYQEAYQLESAVAEFRAMGVKHVINADTIWGEPLQRLLEFLQPYPEFFTTFGSTDTSQLDHPEFERMTLRTLREGSAMGMRGLKFWKNISLGQKDLQGKFIAIDDQRLSPIWNGAAELNLPVLIHIGDPAAFFEPTDPCNERYEELQNHPDWSFAHAAFFSFSELMDQQERLIATNPQTTFIVAHMGSYGENLGRVSEWLSRYPNMYVDLAARINELGRQPYTARTFFEKHQDRILFATDAAPGHLDHLHYYEFLETWNEFIPYSSAAVPGQGRWQIYGIGLSEDILRKVYYQNAETLLANGKFS